MWFSGQVIGGDDQRLLAELRQQQQGIIAQKNMIFVGRLQDTGGDGTADNRSLFLTMATTSYPNELTTNGDTGTPWYNGTTSGATACLFRNGSPYDQEPTTFRGGGGSAAPTTSPAEPAARASLSAPGEAEGSVLIDLLQYGVHLTLKLPPFAALPWLRQV